jgi:hypothetical protein
MAHLLENDRTGYRKLVQNDDDEHGQNLPDYYHTATLDAQRLGEAFPGHRYPKEAKHYYAREAASTDESDALEAAGLPPRPQRQQLSRTDLIDELQRLADDLGRQPTTSDMNDHGAYSDGVYYNRVESWNAALEATDLTCLYSLEATSGVAWIVSGSCFDAQRYADRYHALRSVLSGS